MSAQKIRFNSLSGGETRRRSSFQLWTVFWAGSASIGLWFMIGRRTGFFGDFSRVMYVTTQGDLRQTMEPGTVPQNPYLPAHLRLDRKSYLDEDDVIIPQCPKYDAHQTGNDRVRGAATHEEVVFHAGQMHVTSRVVPQRSVELQVQRAMGESQVEAMNYSRQSKGLA